MDNLIGQIASKEKPIDDMISGIALYVAGAEQVVKPKSTLNAATVAASVTSELTAPKQLKGYNTKELHLGPGYSINPPIHVDIPNEIKLRGRGAVIRKKCERYIEFVQTIASTAIYTGSYEKCWKLLWMFEDEKSKNNLNKFIQRVGGVIRNKDDSISNIRSCFDLTKYSEICWDILNEWTEIKDFNTPKRKVEAATALIGNMRQVMTCRDLLSKKFVHPEVYNNCAQILEKFAFHPAADIRKAVTKELNKLRKIYSLRCHGDLGLEKLLNGTVLKKLHQIVATETSEMAEVLLSPWMDTPIPLCDSDEMEVFCIQIIPRYLKIPHMWKTVFGWLSSLFASHTNRLPLNCIERVLIEMHKIHAELTSSPANYFCTTIVEWLLVMQEVLFYLVRLDTSVTCEALPESFRAVAAIEENKKEFQMTNDSSIRMIDEAIFDTYRTFVTQIVAPVYESDDLAEKDVLQLRECFEVVASDLHETNHRAQFIFALIIDSSGPNHADLWIGTVRDYRDLGEKGIAAAIRVLGPEMVLQRLPLEDPNGNLSSNSDLMIRLLNENVRVSSIRFFLDKILPLAVKFARNMGTELVLYNTYQQDTNQLFKLLPCFCAAATDIETNFKHIPQIIIDLIKDRAGLRSTGMMALRNCLLNAKISKKQEALDAVTKYEKHFLPVLYDLYLTIPGSQEDAADRVLALDCLKMIFAMSKTALTKDTILRAVANLNVVSNDTKTAFVKHSIIQLFCTLLPWLNCQMIRVIYVEYLKHLPKIENEQEQKDAYRLLKLICSYPKHSGSKKFVATNKKKLHSLLWECLNTPFLFNNRQARFKVLVYLVMAQSSNSNPRSTLANMVVFDALLTLKSTKLSVKSKNLACDALICVFRSFLFHKQVSVFLAMIAFNLFIPQPAHENLKSEILAVTCILKNFPDEIGVKNVQLLVAAVLRAMRVPSIAVLVAGLTFFRVYFDVLPACPTAELLQCFFGTLTGIPYETKTKSFVRKQIEITFVALLKKCNFEGLFHYIKTDRLLMEEMERAHNPHKWYDSAIRAIRDEYNYVTEPDEFLPKITRLEDILTDSDFDESDDEDDDCDAPVRRVKMSTSSLRL